MIDSKLLLVGIPLIIIQLILMIVAIVSWAKKDTFKMNKIAWLLIIILINIIGPVLFLIIEGDHNDRG